MRPSISQCCCCHAHQTLHVTAYVTLSARLNPQLTHVYREQRATLKLCSAATIVQREGGSYLGFMVLLRLSFHRHDNGEMAHYICFLCLPLYEKKCSKPFLSPLYSVRPKSLFGHLHPPNTWRTLAFHMLSISSRLFDERCCTLNLPMQHFAHSSQLFEPYPSI